MDQERLGKIARWATNNGNITLERFLDIKWLIDTIGEQQKEIENLKQKPTYKGYDIQKLELAYEINRQYEQRGIDVSDLAAVYQRAKADILEEMQNSLKRQFNANFNID